MLTSTGYLLSSPAWAAKGFYGNYVNDLDVQVGIAQAIADHQATGIIAPYFSIAKVAGLIAKSDPARAVDVTIQAIRQAPDQTVQIIGEVLSSVPNQTEGVLVAVLNSFPHVRTPKMIAAICAELERRNIRIPVIPLEKFSPNARAQMRRLNSPLTPKPPEPKNNLKSSPGIPARSGPSNSPSPTQPPSSGAVTYPAGDMPAYVPPPPLPRGAPR